MIPIEHKSQIIRYCERMDRLGWVANHDGNITVRTASNAYAATPTARSKADLKAEDLIEVDGQGKKLTGSGAPFSELSIHLRVYRARPDVQAVVHAHPPSATAVGCSGQEMRTSALPEAVVSLGPGVPLVGLALPGSESIWRELDALIPHYDAVMFGGNGVFAWGRTLEQAFLRMELVEHLAKILIASTVLGGPRTLNSDQVSTLLRKRAEAGLALPRDPHRSDWFPV